MFCTQKGNEFLTEHPHHGPSSFKNAVLFLFIYLFIHFLGLPKRFEATCKSKHETNRRE